MSDRRWHYCPECGERDTNSVEMGGSPTCWHCMFCGFIECDSVVFNHAEAWKVAATLKDRTRREIRRRARAGESLEVIASDYLVPVPFVQLIAAWQMSEDDAPDDDSAEVIVRLKAEVEEAWRIYAEASRLWSAQAKRRASENRPPAQGADR